jgi:hypothetical protein
MYSIENDLKERGCDGVDKDTSQLWTRKLGKGEPPASLHNEKFFDELSDSVS